MKLYIHPKVDNNWLASTITKYPGLDGEGYSIPQTVITTDQLDPASLQNFATIVGYFVQLGGGAWNATLVIVEPAPVFEVEPAVMDGETLITPAVVRNVLAFAISDKRASDGADRTWTMNTEELPTPVRDAALAIWTALTS